MKISVVFSKKKKRNKNNGHMPVIFIWVLGLFYVALSIFFVNININTNRNVDVVRCIFENISILSSLCVCVVDELYILFNTLNKQTAIIVTVIVSIL
jgi:hypothetical protein